MMLPFTQRNFVQLMLACFKDTEGDITRKSPDKTGVSPETCHISRGSAN